MALSSRTIWEQLISLSIKPEVLTMANKAHKDWPVPSWPPGLISGPGTPQAHSHMNSVPILPFIWKALYLHPCTIASSPSNVTCSVKPSPKTYLLKFISLCPWHFLSPCYFMFPYRTYHLLTSYTNYIYLYIMYILYIFLYYIY